MPIITLVFIIIFIGGLLTALIVDGAWAFFAYQFVYFMNPGDRWWGKALPSISYSFICVMVMGFALLVKHRDSHQLAELSRQPLTKWLVGIMFMYLLLILFALDAPAHKYFTISLVKLFVVLGIAYKLITTEVKLRYALWSYILGATYIGYVAFTTGRNRGIRVEGIGTVDSPDANGIAAAITPALVLLIYYAWLGNRYVKTATVICAAFIVNGIVLINSRGAFLGAAVGGAFFICYMLFSRQQRSGQRAMAVFIIVAGLAGSFSLTDAAFWERMGTIKEYDDGEKSGSHRVEFWMATFDMVRDRPMGLGARGYNRVSRYYLDPVKYGDKNKSVHSMWFQALSEIGWLGMVFFLGMFACCYRISQKTKQYLTDNNKVDQYFLMIALEGSLLSFITAGTFINRSRAEVLYWLVLFIACAVNIFFIQHQSKDKKI